MSRSSEGAKSSPEAASRHDVISTSADSIVQPDGGWGWTVCISCGICNGVVFGTINSFGILYVTIRDEYSNSGSNISFRTAWVGSVCTGLTFLLSSIAGVISDSIGIRKTGLAGAVVALAGILSSAFVENLMLLYLTFGVLIGVGFSLVFSQSFVILGHYFKRHLGLVNGFTASGGAVFTVAASLGLPEVLDCVGLQKTFLTLSGLVALLIPCTLTWKPIFPRRIALSGIHQNSSSDEGSTEELLCSSGFCQPRSLNMSIWKNKNYVRWTFFLGLGLLGYFVPFIHLVKYVDDEFPGYKGNLLILYIAGSAGISRIVVGKLADFHWVRRLSIQLVALAIYGVCTLCIPFTQTYEVLVGVTVILGICDGASTCMSAPVAIDLVGEVNASQALGFLFGMMAIPVTAGPPLAGLLYDHLGSYKLAFHIAGCFPIIGAFLMLFIKQPSAAHIAS